MTLRQGIVEVTASSTTAVVILQMMRKPLGCNPEDRSPKATNTIHLIHLFVLTHLVAFGLGSMQSMEGINVMHLFMSVAQRLRTCSWQGLHAHRSAF